MELSIYSLMEWLTGTGTVQYGINKKVLFSGMAGWEVLKYKKGIMLDKVARWSDNKFKIVLGAEYLDNGMAYDPVEDLSDWRFS